MTVSILSLWAKIVLIASMTLEISPPDATLAKGFNPSEIFVEIKNSTLSKPFGESSVLSKCISNLTFGSSNFSSFSIIKPERTCA